MQSGEIVVSGDHVLKSYLRGRGNEETKFQVGAETWHRTGDAGKLDHDGRLWLLGRCSAKIKDERGEIYPFPVECGAMEHPEIRRVAFLSFNGRRILAIESAGTGNETILDKLRTELAWAGLDEIRPFDHLPVDKRHNAKIDYPALRKLFEK
jgi:acyl-CoA synthetase (AMP-forming)/AMP-acid ligase II